MINLVISVNSKKANLKKTLMSVLLQLFNKKIKVLLVYANDELLYYYNNIVEYFDDVLDIKKIICSNSSLFQCGLYHCDCKYVMFLRENDFFYDAFSIESLYKKIVSGNNYDFVYGDYVRLDDRYDYLSIENYYLFATGKLFDVEFLKTNNILFNSCMDVEFVSKCFLLSDNYMYTDSILCVNSFDYNLIDLLEKVVKSICLIFNVYDGLIDKNILNDYIFENYNYLKSLYVEDLNMILSEDFFKIIMPLEKIRLDILGEV